MADIAPDSANRRVYMLKEGEDAEAIIDLSALYELDIGSFRVSYLLSTMPCSVYTKPNSILTSSNNLKYLHTIDNLELVLGFEDETVVVLEPIHFELPGKKAN